jgi:ribosome assembly protein YihI (activator of Der GTPase)
MDISDAWYSFAKSVNRRVEIERSIADLPNDSCKEYDQLNEQLEFFKNIEKAQKQYLSLLLDHIREMMAVIEDGEEERYTDENSA